MSAVRQFRLDLGRSSAATAAPATPMPAKLTQELRNYQAKNEWEIIQALREKEHPLHILATGGGKTPVVVKLAWRAARQGKRFLFLVHRKTLLQQASQKLTRAGLPHGLIVPGRHLCNDLIHVGSVDTLASRLHEYRPYLKSVYVSWSDEAHHVLANEWDGVLTAMPNALHGGSTATGYRPDLEHFPLARNRLGIPMGREI